MRITIKSPVLNYENLPAVDQGEEDPMTIRDVMLNALNANIPGDVLTAEIKNKIYQISKKIYDSNEPDFTVEQLSLIKERVGKAYAPMVFGYVAEVIDGNVKPIAPIPPKREPKEVEAKTSETTTN